MLRSAFLILLVAVLAGCGGGGGSDRLAADEYRQKADQICRDANAKIAAVETPQTAAGVREAAGKVKPIVEDAVADLKKLEPPKELEANVDKWMDQNDRLIDGIEEIKNTKSEQELQSVGKEYSALNDESNATAKQLGLVECAKGSD